MKLIETILDKMMNVGKPQRKFLLKAIEAFLSVSGRLTFSNMSRYVDLCPRTFARQFSKKFDFAAFNSILLDLLYGTTKRKFAIAFDPFFIEKSGEKTHGAGWFWSGSDGKAKKGLEASLLSVIDIEGNTGYALHAHQTPTTAELETASSAEKVVTRIDWFLQYILSQAHMFPEGVFHILVDAYFFKEKFVTGICNAGFHVVSKMRKDARLLLFYSGPQKARGRHKKFDGYVDFEQLSDIVVPDDSGITLRATLAYAVALKREVLVVMVRKLRSDGRVMEALIFSTDTAIKPLDVYQYYGSRFQIEFVIRDAKQYAGLTHFQSRTKERIDTHIQLSFLAINIARFKEQKRLIGAAPGAARSVATQHVRHHNEMLIQSFFSIFGLDSLAIKSHPGYEQALNFGAIHV